MDHDIRDIPNTHAYAAKSCSKNIIARACYKCGLWVEALEDYFTVPYDCEKLMNDKTMVQYQSGGALDPFAGYREIPQQPKETRPKETRPGLAEETINRSAYDEFMKGL